MQAMTQLPVEMEPSNQLQQLINVEEYALNSDFPPENTVFTDKLKAMRDYSTTMRY